MMDSGRASIKISSNNTYPSETPSGAIDAVALRVGIIVSRFSPLQEHFTVLNLGGVAGVFAHLA